MKKYCKNINITDRDLISRAVYNCIDDKYTRSDTLRMFEEYSGVKCEVIYGLVKEYGKHIVYPLVETVIDGIRQELLYKKILIKPIWYSEKGDILRFMIRRIGMREVDQSISE